MTRNELISVFDDTTKRIEDGEYPSTVSNRKVNLQNYQLLKTINPIVTNIDVVNQDCVKVAGDLSKLGKTCILNMASFKKPGGGVKTGAMAQEEELARRSNLMCSLPQEYYPLSVDEFIYSDDVTFFKDSSYNVIDSFKSDVITIAAINLNESDKPKDYENIMRLKVRNMLYLPLNNGCKNLVLSAFGCGVFKNDPHFVSNLFKSVLNTGYLSRYENITFAILNDRNSVGSNYEIFKSVLTNGN